MPTGIVLKSASHEVSDEVRQKNLQAVVESAGYEVAEPEAPAEPKRDDFKTEEEFEAAHVEWQEAQEAVETKEIEEEEQKPAAKPSRKQRAIDRATQKLQEELRQAKERLAVLESKKEPEKELVKPKRAEFGEGNEGDEKYEEALIAWGVEKTKKEGAIKDAEAANKARFEEHVQNYAAGIEEVREAHDDYDELKERFEKEDVFIGKETQLALLELENGAEVTYYLMRHPAAAAKLGETCRVNPLSAVMEVGRLSMRLKTGAPAPGEANGEETRKSKPKVPAPVRTVNTGGSSEGLTFAEIAAKPNYPGKAKDLRRAMSANQ
jgi:hypothetical protein